MNVGVVCEGLNDFLALREIVSVFATRAGKTLNRFDPIQPKVDATSRQVNGGGWRRVQAWLKENSGESVKDILAPRLFSASPNYDILIIHLDGDVYYLDDKISAADRARCFGRPKEISKLIEHRIHMILDPPDDLDDQILYAVPVMHMESWLLAAVVRGPLRRNIENIRLKHKALRYLAYRFPNDDRFGSLTAARELGRKLNILRAQFESLDHFAAKLEKII